MIMWYSDLIMINCKTPAQMKLPTFHPRVKPENFPNFTEAWKPLKLKSPEKNARTNVMIHETESLSSSKQIRKEGRKHLEWIIRMKAEHWPWHMPEKKQGSIRKPDEGFSNQYHSERENLVDFNSTRAAKGRERVCVHIVTSIQPYQDRSGSMCCLLVLNHQSKTCFTFGSFSQ